MNDIGYLYVICDGSKVKIGKSKTPEKRVKGLINTCGIDAPKVFISAECSEVSKKEKECHKRFNSKNIHSEWFLMSFKTAKSFVALIAGSECLKEKKEQDDYSAKKRQEMLNSVTKSLLPDTSKSECANANFDCVFKDTLEIVNISSDSSLIDQLMNVGDSLERLLIVRCMALSDVLAQSHEAITYYQLKLGFES
jgi:hypothetical protein